MKNILRNRLALSTVVTTLIILVVSVLLAGVVTYFAINVTSTRVQEESVTVQKIHVWMSGETSGKAQAAFMLINTGGRDIVINKITVRGQSADWSHVFTIVPAATVSDDLGYVDSLADNSKYNTVQGTTVTASTDGLSVASGAITFQSGKTMIVYIDSPDSITLNDIGLTVGITVFTSQAMYYQEANVQAYVASGT
jgi:hypothetical protein